MPRSSDRPSHHRQAMENEDYDDDDEEEQEQEDGAERIPIFRKSSSGHDDQRRHSASSPGSKKKKRKLTSSSHHHHHHNRHHHPHAPQQPHVAAAEPPHAAAAAGGLPDIAVPAGASPAEVAAATMLEHFRMLLQAEGSHEPDVDIQKARNVLEAAAGDVQMAAQLYWDDYLATQAAANHAAAVAAAQPPPPPEESEQKKPAARNMRQDSGEEDEDSDDEEEEEDDDEDDYGNVKPLRKLRRSLDKDFGRAANEPEVHDESAEDDNDDGDNEEEEEDDDADDEGEHHMDDDNINDNDNIRDRQHQQRQHLADVIAAQQARLIEMGESVSVSDDEAGGTGVWKIVGSMVAQLDEEDLAPANHDNDNNNNNPRARNHGHPPPNHLRQRIRDAAAVVANKVLPPVEDPDEEDSIRKKKALEEEEDEDADDYISDSDWLEDDGASIRSPFEVLWGTGDRTEASSSPVNENNNAAEGNVVAIEDADEPNPGSGVPHTWLNASFTLSDCGTGLTVKPPKVEDIEFFAWRQQQNQGRNSRGGVPPPYHCKAVTALLSVVTAMIFTGASIQGQVVNCTKAKKPFLELTPEERKREFDSRLADALSALIYIAAKASMERKRRAMKKVNSTKMENEVKAKTMQRRLRLIPTCSWEDDLSSGIPRPPDGPLYRQIQVATSLTNMHDIHFYVLSNLRAFTTRGGVALLLETILRVHGKGVVARMVQRARQEQAKLSPEATAAPPQNSISLIGCTCEERQKKMLDENPLPASVRNDPSQILDTTPPGHECVSVELISLLLTGRVHSSWKGWSTAGLDFGILTSKTGEVGCPLARPEKPVWVLVGEKCYSVLWLDDAMEHDPRKVSKLDKPGAVLTLGHWNCWYGERSKSGMRLITAAAKWNIPTTVSKKVSATAFQASRDPLQSRDTIELLLERRAELLTNIVSADEHEANEAREKESRITPDQLERAMAHPEDEEFYPGNYRMWRFDMGGGGDDDDDEEVIEDKKMRAGQWTPYHRLNARQKIVVEMKLGPKIKNILWTRWPGATIDNFTPAEEDGFPIV